MEIYVERVKFLALSRDNYIKLFWFQYFWGLFNTTNVFI